MTRWVCGEVRWVDVEVLAPIKHHSQFGFDEYQHHAGNAVSCDKNVNHDGDHRWRFACNSVWKDIVFDVGEHDAYVLAAVFYKHGEREYWKKRDKKRLIRSKCYAPLTIKVKAFITLSKIENKCYCGEIECPGLMRE